MDDDIPETLEFDRYLLGKMATLFIRKPPRRNPGYAYQPTRKRLPTPSHAGKLGSLTVRTDDSSQTGISLSHGSSSIVRGYDRTRQKN